MSLFFHNELRPQKTCLGGHIPKVRKHLAEARYGKSEVNTSIRMGSYLLLLDNEKVEILPFASVNFFASRASLRPFRDIKVVEHMRGRVTFTARTYLLPFLATPKLSVSQGYLHANLSSSRLSSSYG